MKTHLIAACLREAVFRAAQVDVAPVRALVIKDSPRGVQAGLGA